YRNIASMDPYPGFLNGILSLIFNSTAPDSRYAQEDRSAGPYFHRARAAELLSLFDRRFPHSARRSDLHGKLIAAYATYGASDGVIGAGREFLAAFPAAANRVAVALLMADAYARQNRTREEFAIYDGLLKEMAANSDGVPLGEGVANLSQAAAQPALPARSPDYARVLDRYISRLVALRRVPQALAVYRNELDRNPNDPGLYERLAAFLEQNRLGAAVEQVYRNAMRQFAGRSWSEKLARWYLRHKQTAQLQQLTADVVKTFSGTELQAYFADVLPQGEIGAALYRQLNVYAHRRFPHNLTFVHNLLLAYQTKGTADPAAYETLLRENWPYTEDLRDRFFELLSRTKRLDSELRAVRTVGASPEASRLLAEGEAWRCHFEAAAPLFRALEAEDPGDVDLGIRTASLDRSLAAFDPKLAASAIAAETKLAAFDPRDSGPLTRIGEIYSDREQFDKARPYWDRIAAIKPGKSGGYLEAATVFW
ncbi:MAG: tetratricopeptide repeat protein, partial [Bryobacteraceae bacterium]